MVQRQVRQGTNLVQHAETRQIRTHRYLLKKPQTHHPREHESHTTRLNGQGENELVKIDDPLVDKRMLFPCRRRCVFFPNPEQI